ncbi:MAG: hypothetical protein MHPSP_002485, partial [Paramarteilia canceri]
MPIFGLVPSSLLRLSARQKKCIKTLRSGKYAPSRSGKDHRLTYEMANPPETIGVTKGHLSHNA